MLASIASRVWVDGEPRDIGRDFRSGGITGLHPTREGYLYISANTPHFWRALCEKVNLPELAANERYDTVRKRAQHAVEIVPKLHGALHERTALEWEAHFGDDVRCAAPSFGEHTRAVLESAGCSPAEIERLEAARLPQPPESSRKARD